jgi:hypothetical protein
LAIQEEDAAVSRQIGYMARAMIWASMPHKKIDGAHYRCDNGIATITMLVGPETGLPYGKLPRLIAAWLTREATFPLHRWSSEETGSSNTSADR